MSKMLFALGIINLVLLSTIYYLMSSYLPDSLGIIFTICVFLTIFLSINIGIVLFIIRMKRAKKYTKISHIKKISIIDGILISISIIGTLLILNINSYYIAMTAIFNTLLIIIREFFKPSEV
jgi:sterol desaturase/sphingolipid hydroxylase (fatty acid hydroxylase superfamily)